MVRYSAIGNGFTTEFRFREAINMLWQWPEGKELLRSANASRVKVVTGSLDDAFASYRSRERQVTVNTNFTEVSTWMLADIIAHELRHASDFAAGLWQSNSSDSCLGAEQSAYSTEHRFMVWLSRTLHPEGLPNRYDLLSRVSTEDQILASNVYEIGTSIDMASLVRRDYHESCQV
jgi:hypothetical protein